MMHTSRVTFSFVLCLLGVVSLLSACGYHLKGQNTLPDSVKFIQLNSGNAPVELKQILEQELTRAGAVLVDAVKEKNGQTVLTVSDFAEDNRQRQGTEYALTLRANVSVTGATKNRNVRTQYIYTKDEGNPLVNSQVVSNARARLYKELAQNIVNVLTHPPKD